MATAAHFIAHGLRAQERCLYGGYSEDALGRFRDQLGREGIDVSAVEAAGALILLTKETAHLVDGRFDSERMLRMLNEAIEDALDAGYTAFRCCGDMTWLLDDTPGASQVMEYEALVTALFKNARGIAMCQYDRRRFTREAIDDAIAVHTSVIGAAGDDRPWHH